MLDLGFNKLRQVTGGSFLQFQKLKYLGLSQNLFTNISAISLHGLNMISVIDLSGNQIKTVRKDDFISPKLVPFGLSLRSNGLENIEFDKHYTFTILDLSHNRLRNASFED